MGRQPGVRGGGVASITALGDVMSRWPGTTEEPVPPRNNPSFHPRPTSALHRLLLGWSSGERRKKSSEPGDASLMRFKPPSYDNGKSSLGSASENN